MKIFEHYFTEKFIYNPKILILMKVYTYVEFNGLYIYMKQYFH